MRQWSVSAGSVALASALVLLGACGSGSNDDREDSALREACEILNHAIADSEPERLAEELTTELDDRVEAEGLDPEGHVARVVVAADAHRAGAIGEASFHDSVGRMSDACSGAGFPSVPAEGDGGASTGAGQADAVNRGCAAGELYLGELHATRVAMNETIREVGPGLRAAGPDAEYVWSLLLRIADEEESPTGSAGSLLIGLIDFCRDAASGAPPPTSTPSSVDGGRPTPEEVIARLLEDWTNGDLDQNLSASESAREELTLFAEDADFVEDVCDGPLSSCEVSDIECSQADSSGTATADCSFQVGLVQGQAAMSGDPVGELKGGAYWAVYDLFFIVE